MQRVFLPCWNLIISKAVTLLPQLMTEILFGIRVIKFYNWEPYFAQKVGECRQQELAHLKAIKYLDAMCVYTWAALPVVISILTFVTYVLLGHQLTAAKVGRTHLQQALFKSNSNSNGNSNIWDSFSKKICQSTLRNFSTPKVS